MDDYICGNCIYFRQHYILEVERCTAINCGHCIYPRLKNRKPGSEACANYSARTTPLVLPDREQVIRFLTTEMLQHILDIDLPPEVKGRE